MVLLLLVAVFVGSWIGTGVLRRYALSRSVLDVPNHRSSHAVPTPRGGGVAIVVMFLIALVLLTWTGHVETSAAIALGGTGLLVALVGFVDDHRHLPARWRLLAHFGAAAWAIAWLGGLHPVVLLGNTVDLGVAGDLIAVVALVWLLNLYNFMDGIDGIAGVEALTVCAGAAVLYLAARPSGHEGTVPLVLAAATLGFLGWNFPPARIFLGDVGSGFLGIVLGMLAIRAGNHSPQLFWSWLILLGVFVVDATFTLVRRMARRERIYEAHRSHAYQHAARQHGGHLPVTIAVGAINVVWLLPIAFLVTRGDVDGVLGTVLAYAPLIGLAAWFGAGADEREDSSYRT
jgi:Fuc2NAc and GlcNAc transferase